MSGLASLSRTIAEETIFSNSFYEAAITLMPKPDKDNPIKEKYRPISLINIDAKILKKNFGQHNSTTHQKFIHHDQIVFIAVMQGFFNICKSINMIYCINK